MRIATRLVLVASVLAAPSLEAAPTPTRTVILDCANGWHGDAGGQYGGVFFQLSCENGVAKQKLTGYAGGAYAVRVGVESSSVGADCFYSGVGPTVNGTCIGVSLRIL